MTEHIYVPINTRPKRGRPYFAIGGVHWTAQGARNFMGDEKEWRRLSREGWKIIKYELPMPKGRSAKAQSHAR